MAVCAIYFPQLDWMADPYVAILPACWAVCWTTSPLYQALGSKSLLSVLRLTAYNAQQRVLFVMRTRVLKAVDKDKEVGNNRQ